MHTSNLTFRSLTEEDLEMLHGWLGRPHLLRWWGDEPTLVEVREKYLPRITGLEDAHPFIASMDATPIGYIQWYSVTHGDPNWWPDTPGAGVIGIDQFIADPKLLGQGIGTALITQFVDLLLKDASVREIRVDPRPDNVRAIRCYQKVGFRDLGTISTPDGPAIMMTLSANEFTVRM